MSAERSRGWVLPGVAANLIILAPLAFAWIAYETAPDLYRRSVQEDEVLEWTTFWAFALAGAGFLRSALAARKLAQPWWFLAGLALFCGFVAGEEVSWGQRLFAYRPPPYFLEHNFQQELNLHNVVDTDLRKAAFLAVTLGYGALLPLAFAVAPLRRFGARLGVVSPPAWLIPGFLATAAIYVAYPWSHTGEWAEAMLGLGFLLAASHTGVGGPLRAAVAAGSAFALGFVTTLLWWAATGHDPERATAAGVELQALQEDFARARTRTRCGLHKRVYSAVRKYDQDHLYEGVFASLVAGGLPQERADFFLDPWNSPYWIRHECSPDRRRRAIFVYSFGANRLRDSSDWEIVEDDLGAWISRPGGAPKNESDAAP